MNPMLRRAIIQQNQEDVVPTTLNITIIKSVDYGYGYVTYKGVKYQEDQRPSPVILQVLPGETVTVFVMGGFRPFVGRVYLNGTQVASKTYGVTYDLIVTDNARIEITTVVGPENKALITMPV